MLLDEKLFLAVKLVAIMASKVETVPKEHGQILRKLNQVCIYSI
jgi:hypothetical protein